MKIDTHKNKKLNSQRDARVWISIRLVYQDQILSIQQNGYMPSFPSSIFDFTNVLGTPSLD